MKYKILEILDRNKKEVDWKRNGIIDFVSRERRKSDI